VASGNAAIGYRNPVGRQGKFMPAVDSALVSGGGVAGPVAATALAKTGIGADVCEAHSPGSRLPMGLAAHWRWSPTGSPRCASSTPTTLSPPPPSDDEFGGHRYQRDRI
jgi:hypothetical protein